MAKIIQLRAENFKRLVAVEIRPDGSLVQITGANGAGKSSVIDAIWAAVGGKKVAPKEPIRRGQDSAMVQIQTEDLVITRTFTRRDDDEISSALKVEAKDGKRLAEPQAVLDRLLAPLTLDPGAFERMDPAQKFDLLRSFVPGVDFAAIAKADREDFEERTIANRRAKEERTLADAIDVPDAPSEPVDVAALVAELRRAGEQNALTERRQAVRDGAMQKINAARDGIARSKKMIEELQAGIAEYQEEATTLQRKLNDADPLPPMIDTSAIQDQIANASEANKSAELMERRANHVAASKQFAGRAHNLTLRMEQRKADKVAAIAAAKFPVKGLSFGDGDVPPILLDGVPFEQASDAQRLRASMALAMALAPELRIVRVKGNDFDDNAIKTIADMAEAQDFQIWMERVDTTGKVGIVIESGEVVRVNKAGK